MIINITVRSWYGGIYEDIVLAVPTRYRKLIGSYCAWVGTAPNGYWLSSEPALWLQLPGVVVQG